MKSYKKRIEEERCKGYGSSYVPFIKATEAKGLATTSIIPDPIEERQIHCLSSIETNFYYHLRYDPTVVHIREQFLLDTGIMNAIAEEYGVNCGKYYTTDFLVDHADGTQRAYSVKGSTMIFDENNRIYKGRKNKYYSMILRQDMERIYWESQDIAFSIVTKEDLNPYLPANMTNVMKYYNPTWVTDRHQKLLYLIAHGDVYVPLDRKCNFQQLTECADFDIDKLFETMVAARKELIDE